MPRPTATTLPDEGLLVGWSLEGEPRRKLVGFRDTADEAQPARTLEPILHTGGGHLVTIAPTGAGKGVGCIIPALLRYPGPVVVIDPKGENYWVTAQRRRELGQRVIALDPFQILNLPDDERGRFNPLDFLSPKNESLVEDAEMIANILMSSAGDQHTDRFWPYMGAQLLILMLLFQFKKLEPADWTLAKTRDLLSKSPADFAEFGKELLNGSDPELRRLASVATNPAEATFGGYWAFAQMQTACLKGSLIGDCIGSSSFSLQELVDGDPLSIYLVIPPEKLESHANLLKLWLSVMIAALTHRRSRPEHSTLFIVDEAAQLGHMPQLRQAITLLRGYGVRVWSFWQDLSQMQGLYPRTWETLLNNSQVQQFFGQVTLLGAEQTHSVTGLGSPGFLQTLDRGEMVLSVLGDEPVIAQVPNYLRDEPFAGSFESNPYHLDAPQEDDEAAIGRSGRVFRRSDFRKKSPELGLDQHKLFDRNLGDHKLADYKLVDWRLVCNPGFRASDPPDVESVEPEDKVRLFAKAASVYEGLDDVSPSNVAIERVELPFYPDYDYYELRLWTDERRGFAQFLEGRGGLIPILGSAAPIHDTNDRYHLRLEYAHVQSYLRFFCNCINATEGRFLLVEQEADLRFDEPVSEEYQRTLSEIIKPMSLVTPVEGENNQADAYRVTATVLYGDSLFRAAFVVLPDGQVNMSDDEELLGSVPVMSDEEALGTPLSVR